MSKTIGINGGKDALALGKITTQSFGHYKHVPLAKPEPQIIRAGIYGGLPNDAITTDLFNGCLPANKICYGECFAAREAFEKGINFGTRVKNILDSKILAEDLTHLPAEQRFV
jgi:hypothetical protein